MNGLEPLRLSACEFESHVSTNSTTSPQIAIIQPVNQDIYKSDYDYEIPEKLVARYPTKNRTDSKLLLCKDQNFSIENFSTISNFFEKDDLIVFNETKVFKARLILQKDSGGKTEIFINRIFSKFEAECLTKGLNLKKKSQVLKTDTFPLQISILNEKDGLVIIKFSQNVEHLCSIYGKVPIPPYLKRDDDESDNVRYQTVFANDVFKESAAAPTASLHFDNELYEKITNEFYTCKINLAVGLGTFKPLSDDAINDSSKLHEENFFISDESAKKINAQLKNNKRIIAIGTTTLRAIESSWNNETNSVSSGNQATTIFIKKGFKFNVANALLTNFHLPQSSLLMMVCAFAGKEFIFSAYDFAIKNNLRFFSYGDAMIIERCPFNY